MSLRRGIQLFLTLAALIAAQPFAQAQASPSQDNACGSTVEDKLSAAQKSLQSNDAASMHAALGCLIQATTEINARDASNAPAVVHFVPHVTVQGQASR